MRLPPLRQTKEGCELSSQYVLPWAMLKPNSPNLVHDYILHTYAKFGLRIIMQKVQMADRDVLLHYSGRVAFGWLVVCLLLNGTSELMVGMWNV